MLSIKVFDGLNFKKTSSLLHRLDPRAKFLAVCVIFAGAMLFPRDPMKVYLIDFILLLFIFLLMIPIVISGKILKEWLRTLKGATIFGAFIFIIVFISNYLISSYTITISTILLSSAMTVRFLILILAFSIFFLSTSPDDFSLALRQSRIPYEFCFAFTTALRFVPVLATEAQSISDAQRSRGLELEKGKFLKRIKNYIPILIPLVVNSIRRSLELAEAMESRGFGLKKERTSLYVLKLKRPDYVALCLAAISIFILIYVRYFMILPTFL